MDWDLFDCYVAKLRKEHGVDPFSWAFIFDGAYASIRNNVLVGPTGRRTLLSLILERMNERQKKLVFSMTFDLGSHQEFEESDVKYRRDDLANELDVDPRTQGVTVEPGSFRTIEKWIKEMTGHPFGSHLRRNSRKALKVLKLLYLLQKRRQSSFLRLIRPVRRGKGSLEHRDCYPLTRDHSKGGGFDDQVWLLADLKSYLGMELSSEFTRRVQAVMSGLLERVEQRVNITEMRLRNQFGDDLDAWDQVYRREIAELRETCRTDASSSVTHDLDELMFVYVHALPLMHFAAECEQIVEQTLPNADVAPVRREIEGLSLMYRMPDGGYTRSDHVQIADAATFYEFGRDQQVRSIVEKATGHPIEVEKYGLLAKRSVNLLSRYFAYKRNTIEYDSISVTLRSCIVAMCAVWLEMCHETSYKPYWLGQQAQGERILEFLDQPFLEQGSLLHQSYPAAIDQIWSMRFEWMTDAVHGLQEIGSLRAAYKVIVLKRLAANLACLDIDKIERLVEEGFPSFEVMKVKVGVSQV